MSRPYALIVLTGANLMAQAIFHDGLPQHLSALFTAGGGKDALLFIVGVGLIVLGIVLESLFCGAMLIVSLVFVIAFSEITLIVPRFGLVH